MTAMTQTYIANLALAIIGTERIEDIAYISGLFAIANKVKIY